MSSERNDGRRLEGRRENRSLARIRKLGEVLAIHTGDGVELPGFALLCHHIVEEGAEFSAREFDADVRHHLDEAFEIEFCGDAGGCAIQDFEQAFLLCELGRCGLERANVRTRPQPGQDGAVYVADGRGAREEGARRGVSAAQHQGRLVGLPGFHGAPPAGGNRGDMLRIMQVAPGAAEHLLFGRAGVVVPGFVEPDRFTVGRGHPGRLRQVVGQRGQRSKAGGVETWCARTGRIRHSGCPRLRPDNNLVRGWGRQGEIRYAVDS